MDSPGETDRSLWVEDNGGGWWPAPAWVSHASMPENWTRLWALVDLTENDGVLVEVAHHRGNEIDRDKCL